MVLTGRVDRLPVGGEQRGFVMPPGFPNSKNRLNGLCVSAGKMETKNQEFLSRITICLEVCGSTKQQKRTKAT